MPTLEQASTTAALEYASLHARLAALEAQFGPCSPLGKRTRKEDSAPVGTEEEVLSPPPTTSSALGRRPSLEPGADVAVESAAGGIELWRSLGDAAVTGDAAVAVLSTSSPPTPVTV